MFFVLGLFQTVFVAGWLSISALQRRFAGVGSSAYAIYGALIALWAVGELMVLAAEGPQEFSSEARCAARFMTARYCRSPSLTTRNPQTPRHTARGLFLRSRDSQRLR